MVRKRVAIVWNRNSLLEANGKSRVAIKEDFGTSEKINFLTYVQRIQWEQIQVHTKKKLARPPTKLLSFKKNQKTV